MQTAEFKAHIKAPIERVWDFWSNYEGYSALKIVGKSELLEEGGGEGHGVGAVRKVRIRGITFIEKIVTFEPPHRLEYHIEKCTIPMRHEIGTMEFTSSGGGTDVLWATAAELALPKIGLLLVPILGLLMGRAFQNALDQSKEILESGQPSF